MPGVLDGIRVIDFCRYIAGPFCTALLADLGAEVIRIEKIGGSEDRFPSPITPDGIGATFLQLNRNKKSVTLDLSKPQSKDIVRRLVATADIVAANVPPNTLVSMGIDYASLKAIKPDIILTTMNAFGANGPYSDRVGFDGIAQVMSGNAYMGGTPDQPVKSYAPYCDYGTASLATVGTLAALMHRNQTGEGQIVEGVLLRTAMTFNNPTLIEQSALNINRVGTLNRSQAAAPVDIYKTKDGNIIVQVISQPLFKRWCRLMGLEEWYDDPRFQDDDARGRNWQPLNEKMVAWAAERTTDEAVASMEAARLPCGPVLSPQQTLNDPHVHAAGYFKHLDYPGLDTPLPIMDFPVRMSASPGEVQRRPPTVGEHTEEVLLSLGYSHDALAAFRAEEVI